MERHEPIYPDNNGRLLRRRLWLYASHHTWTRSSLRVFGPDAAASDTPAAYITASAFTVASASASPNTADVDGAVAPNLAEYVDKPGWLQHVTACRDTSYVYCDSIVKDHEASCTADRVPAQEDLNRRRPQAHVPISHRQSLDEADGDRRHVRRGEEVSTTSAHLRCLQYSANHSLLHETPFTDLYTTNSTPSTVSKVLSRKDKWLNPEDRNNSPIKKAKGKIPDIDKTLANWLRNEQHKGRHVSDTEIQEQARMYARPFREAETKINNPSWLEKFKQKHSLGGRLIRRASETNIPSAAAAKLSTTSPILADSQPSSAISSASPVHQHSASPFSGVRAGGEEEKEGRGNSIMMDFNEAPSGAPGNSFKHASANHSTTSLGSVFTSETAGSSFSDHTMSPSGTSQFTFSPDPNVGGFLSSDQARHIPPGGPNFQRPRSQTFPTLDLEYMNQSTSHQPGEPETPKFASAHPGSTAPSSALESPAHEFSAAGPFGLDTAMSPHHQPSHPSLHHSSSSSSLQGRGPHQQQGGSSTTPVIGSASLSSVASSPVSPSQEDARRAADTLLSFIANSGPNGFVDQNDYNAVIRLTEKLRLHQQAQQAQQRVQGGMGMGPSAMSGLGMGIGIGGLDRIPEGDAEMGNTGHLVEGQGDYVKSEGTMAV